MRRHIRRFMPPPYESRHLKGEVAGSISPFKNTPFASDESADSSARLSVDHRNAHLAKVHQFWFDLLQIFSQTFAFLNVEILNYKFN